MDIPDDGQRLADAASTMIGCPFRLFGRNPATGLDCVGLLIACLEAIGRNAVIPIGYGLRNSAIERWLGCADRSGFLPADGKILPGDVLITRPGPSQHHLMIVETPRAAIHAHAGLRRVVHEPIDFARECSAHWRLGNPDQGPVSWQH